MINPSKLLRLKTEGNHFVRRHSAFVDFLKKQFRGRIREGDEVTVLVTHHDGRQEDASVRLSAEDVDVIRTVSELL